MHAMVAVNVTVVWAMGDRDRLRKSAELDVCLAAPGAPVITKPAGAEIWTEPRCWVVASLVIVNAKEVVAPAAGLAGDTVTAKHLPEEVQVLAVDPAAGVASIAAASVLAASAPRHIRAIVKPAFRTAATPPSAKTRGMTAPADSSDSLIHRACIDGAPCLRSCDQAVLRHNAMSR